MFYISLIRKPIRYIATVVLMTLVAGLAGVQSAEALITADSLVISRIFANPQGPDFDSEYIEIYNPTPNTVSLNNMQYRHETGAMSMIVADFDSGGVVTTRTIGAFSYFLISNREQKDTLEPWNTRALLTADLYSGDSDWLTDTGELHLTGTNYRDSLTYESGTITMDAVSFLTAPVVSVEGRSLDRDFINAMGDTVVSRLPDTGYGFGRNWNAGSGIDSDSNVTDFVYISSANGATNRDSAPRNSASQAERMIFLVQPNVQTVYMGDTFRIWVTAVGRYGSNIWNMQTLSQFDTAVTVYDRTSFGKLAFANMRLNGNDTFFKSNASVGDTTGGVVLQVLGSDSTYFFQRGVDTVGVRLLRRPGANSINADTWDYIKSDSHLLTVEDNFCTGYARIFIQTHASARIITDTGGDTTRAYAGGRLLVGVADTDENGDRSAVDTVGIQIWSKIGGDTEYWVLTEVGPDRGVFRDTEIGLFLSASPAAKTQNNGLLYVREADSVFLKYVDATDANDSVGLDTVQVDFTSSVAEWRNGANTAGRDTYTTVLDSGYVQVTDKNANLDPTVLDTVRVTVGHTYTGDTAYLYLTETAADTGIFFSYYGVTFSNTGPIPVLYTDLILLIRHRDSSWVLYSDGYDTNNTGDTAQDTVWMFNRQEAGVVQFMDDRNGLDPVDTFRARMDSVYIEVRDSDQNGNPLAPDTFTVTVFVGNDGTGLNGLILDTQIWWMTETADTSGVFRSEGLFLTDTAAGTVNDNMLQVGLDDTIYVIYGDTDSMGGGGDTSIDTALIVDSPMAVMLVQFFDTRSFERQTDTRLPDLPNAPTVASDRSRLFILVADTDENRDPNLPDSIVVEVTSWDKSGSWSFGSRVNGGMVDTLYVVLSETGNRTGYFRSMFGIQSPRISWDDSGPGDTAISAGLGDTIQALYVDENSPSDWDYDTVLVLDSGTKSQTSIYEDAAFTDIIDTLLTRDVMYLEVQDTDQNWNPQSKDTVTVQVLVENRLGGVGGGVGLLIDTEDIVLTETTETSGIFRSVAVIVTDTLEPSVDDGIVSWGLSDTLDVRYKDPDAPAAQPDTTFDTALALVIQTAATLQFYEADSAINAVDTYQARDDSVYIQVIDTDANRNPQSLDTVVVTVRTGNEGTGLEGFILDTQVWVLTEIGNVAGIFRSAGLYLTDTAAGTINDNQLQVGLDDTICVIYGDQDQTAAENDTTIDTALIMDRPAVALLLQFFDTRGFSIQTDTRVPDLGQASTVTFDPNQLFILLVDTDENRDPNLPDSVVVEVTSWDKSGTWADGGRVDGGMIDTMYVLLTETGNRTGYFRSLPNLSAGGSQSYRLTRTDTGFGDTELLVGLGDTIQAVYVDENSLSDSITDTALVTDSGTKSMTFIYEDPTFTDIVDTLLTRDVMYLEVQDTDQNWNPQIKDTVTVQVRVENRVGGSGGGVGLIIDTEDIVLTESTETSGIFHSGAVIVTDTLQPSVNDGTVSWGLSDTLDVRYRDPDATAARPDTSFDTALALEIQTAASIQFYEMDSGVDDVDTYQARGDSLYIQVIDTDANLNPQSIDTVEVTVRTGNDGTSLPGLVLDTQVMVLTEIGNATGIFRSGGLNLSDTIAGTLNDLQLQVGLDDTISAIYGDRNQVAGENDTTIDTALVVDAPTATLLIQFHDTRSCERKIDTLVVVAGRLYVLVADTDENRDPNLPDSIVVEITSWDKSGTWADGGRVDGGMIDTLYMLLTETGNRTGYFRNNRFGNAAAADSWVTTRIDTGSNDSQILAGLGDTIQALYVDENSPSDRVYDTLLMVDSPSVSYTLLYEDANFTDNADTFNTRDVIYIQVMDTDQNWNPQIKDTVTVRVLIENRAGGGGGGAPGLIIDTEDFVLTESTETSGIFRSAAVNLSDTVVPSVNDGWVSWGLRDTMDVRYRDPNAPATDTTFDTSLALEISTTATAQFYENAAFSNAVDTFLLKNDVAYIAVYDTDENHNPQSIDTVSVTVYVSDTTGLVRDTETFVLTESAQTSGIFRSGAINIVDTDAAGFVQNGRLNVKKSDTLHIAYADTNSIADAAADTALIKWVSTVAATLPANGHETTNAKPVVSWTVENDSPEVDSFVVEVSKLLSFASTVFVDTVDLALLKDTLTTLPDNDTYYWRVRAIDYLGHFGPYTDTFGLIIDTTVNQATVAQPANGHETTAIDIVVSWNFNADSVGVDSYALEVSKNSAFANMVFTDTMDAARSNDTVLGLYNDTYYWRVRAIDFLNNGGSYSTARWFVTDTLVNQVSAVQPADGHETTAIGIVVGWSFNADSVGIDSYALEVAKNSTFTNMSFTDTLDATRTNDTITGLYNDTYYWRVRAIDNLASGGPYSATRGFVTDTLIGQVAPAQPGDGHETTAINIVVSWSTLADSVGIDSYMLEVSKNAGFTAMVFTDTLDGTRLNDTVTGLYNDSYYWRVRATDNRGNGGVYSAARGFVTDTIVNTVTVSQPADGHETTAINLVVSWATNADSVGVDSYALEVSKNAAFTNITFTDTVAETRLNDTVTGLYNDTYYWRVRAIDNRGNGGVYSATRGFVTDTIVNQVTVSQPSDGHETTAINLVVSWSTLADSVGIDSYMLEVSKNAGFTNMVFTDTVDGTRLNDTVTGLYNDTYYWRVRAADNRGNGGVYSVTRGFVTDTIVNQVAVSQPADGHETTAINLVVSWAANVDSVGVDSYAVEVAKNAAFTNIVFTDTVAETRLNDTVTGLYNDTYYWRVRAIDNRGNGGPYSALRWFVTDTIVNQATVSQPANGHETTAINIVVSWNLNSDSVGIDSYALEVAKNSTFTNMVFTDTLDATRSNDTITGLYNDTYYWRIRAIDNLANGGPYSVSRWLVTDTLVNQVTAAQPSNGHETTAINLVVSWALNADSVGIDSHALEAAKNSTFTNMVFTDTLDATRTNDTITGLYNDTYYWRVRAIDNLANGGPYSVARWFVTDTIVNQVSLVSPSDGHETTNMSPVVRWNSITDSVGIDSYVVEVSKQSGFTATIIADTLDAIITQDTFSALPDPDTYYWRVRAIDNLRNAGPNSSRGFAVTTYSSAAIYTDAAYSKNADTLLTRFVMYIEIADTDESRNEAAIETVTAQVYVGDNITSLVLDTETLVLTESGVSSGIFRSGAVVVTDSVSPAASDGFVSWGRSDTLHIAYVDANDAKDSSFDTALAIEIPTTSRIQFFEDAAFTDDVDTYRTNDFMYVWLSDTDENRNPQSKDTLSVRVYVGNDLDGIVLDTEDLALTESINTSGIFRSAAVTLSGSSAPVVNDGLLSWGRSDTLHVTYTDPNQPADAVSDTALSAGGFVPYDTILVPADSGIYSGDLTCTFTLFDGDSDYCTATVQYSINGGNTWSTPTVTGSLANLTSSPTGLNKTFVWLTKTDLPDTDISAVRMRVTIFDGAETGPADTTLNFRIDNQKPAILTGVRAVANLTGAETGVYLTWNTSAAVDSAGYHIYRSSTTDSRPSTRINANLISDSSGYLDTTAIRGDSQFYYIVCADLRNNLSDSSALWSAPNAKVVKSGAAPRLRPGDTIAYTLTVVNDGFAPAKTVVLYDFRPANTLLFDSATAPAGWLVDYRIDSGANLWQSTFADTADMVRFTATKTLDPTTSSPTDTLTLKIKVQ